MVMFDDDDEDNAVMSIVGIKKVKIKDKDEL